MANFTLNATWRVFSPLLCIRWSIHLAGLIHVSLHLLQQVWNQMNYQNFLKKQVGNFHKVSLFNMTYPLKRDRGRPSMQYWQLKRKLVFKVWVSPRYLLFCFILFITVQIFLFDWIIYDFLNWDLYPAQDIKRDNKFTEVYWTFICSDVFGWYGFLRFFSTTRTGYRLCARLKLFFY